MCDATIRDGSLICVRPGADHTTHVFHASDCPDRHDQSEAMET